MSRNSAFGVIAIHAVDLLIFDQDADAVAKQPALQGADAVARESARRRQQGQSENAAQRATQSKFPHLVLLF